MRLEARAYLWEALDEYIIVIGPKGQKDIEPWEQGTPVGRTLNEHEAKRVARWLNSGALTEIAQQFSSEQENENDTDE